MKFTKITHHEIPVKWIINIFKTRYARQKLKKMEFNPKKNNVLIKKKWRWKIKIKGLYMHMYTYTQTSCQCVIIDQVANS